MIPWCSKSKLIINVATINVATIVSGYLQTPGRSPPGRSDPESKVSERSSRSAGHAGGGRGRQRQGEDKTVNREDTV